MTPLNTYSSVIPTEMTNEELQSICTEIQTAKNWNQPHALIMLTNGCEYKMDLSRHEDYQNEFKTRTGKTLVV